MTNSQPGQSHKTLDEAHLVRDVYEGETTLVTNGVLEVTGRHPRTLPVYANDHAADLVK